MAFFVTVISLRNLIGCTKILSEFKWGCRFRSFLSDLMIRNTHKRNEKNGECQWIQIIGGNKICLRKKTFYICTPLKSAPS